MVDIPWQPAGLRQGSAGLYGRQRRDDLLGQWLVLAWAYASVLETLYSRRTAATTKRESNRMSLKYANKKCSRCGIEKPLTKEFFQVNRQSKYGFRPDCKLCVSIYRSNPVFVARKKEYNKKYMEENKEKFSAKQREYCYKNKDLISYRTREWYKKNREKAIASALERKKKLLKSNLQYRIAERIRSRTRNAIKLGYGFKKTSTQELLGCTYEELKTHLESLFLIGMNWNNYGGTKKHNNESWHIDHIIPCASFDLSNINQQRKCFHYTNLQPLWGLDNLKKGRVTLSA